MNHIPKISIITSAYNVERYLDVFMASVLTQTFTDFEFIIFEDCSTDRTKMMLMEFARNDSRIKLICNEQNIGVLGFIKNLNSGLTLARGKYISRIDADDIALPTRLEKQYLYLEANPDVFLVAGSFEVIDDSGKVLSRQIIDLDHDSIIAKFPEANPIHHPTVMFRNTGNFFYREKALYCEDRDLWFRMTLDNKKMVVLPTVVIKYRIHENSISNLKRVVQERFIGQVNKWYLERIRYGKDSYDSFKTDDITNTSGAGLQGESYLHTRLIKIKFRNGDMQGARNDIRTFWTTHGYYVWKMSIIYFLLTFAPRLVTQIYKKMIWPSH